MINQNGIDFNKESLFCWQPGLDPFMFRIVITVVLRQCRVGQKTQNFYLNSHFPGFGTFSYEINNKKIHKFIGGDLPREIFAQNILRKF